MHAPLMRSALVAVLMALTTPAAQAQEPWTSGRPDGRAPIGVMGDHVHAAGEVMLSYLFLRMDMEGSRDGTDPLTDQNVLDDYPVTPLNMPMSMHMLGAMWAPTDRVTLMAMVPFVSLEMDHLTGGGTLFTTESSGVGDVELSGIVTIQNQNRRAFLFNAGVSIPTGSVEEMDATPATEPDEVILPYPMQIGSGTFDLEPGITFLGQSDNWSWGLQARGTFRLGENDRDYRLGHAGMGTGWLANRVSDWFSGSMRLEGRGWGNVEGADPALDPAMVYTADPELRGGRRVDGFVGLNLEIAEGTLSGNRLAIEYGRPLWQNLDGPQLESNWTLTVGWQYAFQLHGEPH